MGAAGVPLTGADCFLRAFDDEIRRNHAASHVSQLVLRLGPGFDAQAFTRQVAEAARAQPLLRAPIARPLGLGAPAYRVARAERCPLPAVTQRRSETPRGAALPEIFRDRINQRYARRRGELLHFDVVHYPGGETDVAASWLHMLFDGAGSERFVLWLDECFRGARRPTELPEPDELRAPRRELPLGQAGERATAWQRWVQGFGAQPPHSLAGPLQRVRQALRYDVLTLSPEETARAVARAKQSAGFLTPMPFYLAAAIRAHHAVARLRGSDPGTYLVPLPVNLRPKGMEGAIFRTHVSLLWFQVRPELVEDFDALVADLKRQRIESIRSGLIEDGAHAMDFARYAPTRLYSHMARRHLRGELCSFFFAWTGEFCAGLDSFFGAPVLDGFHVAPVPPSPGSCLAMSLRGGRLSATHVRQKGVFAPTELDAFRAQLRADLVG